MPPVSSAARVALALLLAAGLAACSGTRPRSAPGAPDEVPAAYPAYETFDASPYDAGPPARVEVVHDVPPAVMAGRVIVPGGAGMPAATEPTPPAAPVSRRVDGYRIQIFSGSSRASADAVRARAAAWLARQRGADALQPEVAYLQPYYRVRVGAFATDGAAEPALRLVRSEFPEAFLVPDTVTITE